MFTQRLVCRIAFPELLQLRRPTGIVAASLKLAFRWTEFKSFADCLGSRMDYEIVATLIEFAPCKWRTCSLMNIWYGLCKEVKWHPNRGGWCKIWQIPSQNPECQHVLAWNFSSSGRKLRCRCQLRNKRWSAQALQSSFSVWSVRQLISRFGCSTPLRSRLF